MGIITEQEFIKSIKKDGLKTVYMLYGPERYMLEGCARMLYDRAVTGQALLNFARLDGNKTTVEQIAGETESLPVMSQRRCVAVEDMQLDKLGKNQLELLHGLIAALPETTVLVFLFANTPIDTKRSAVYRKFAETVAKYGDVVEFKHKTKSDLVKLLVKQAAKRGAELSADGARELVERVGTGLTALLAELDKLAAYAGGGEITCEDVRLLVNRGLDSSAFDLAKSVLQNRYKEAFTLLDELFRQKQDEISILAALNMSFIDIYRAKCAQTAGKTESVITSAFQYRGKEFRMRNAMRDCSRFSMPQIRACLDYLAETDRKIKSSRVENRVLLETAIGKMIVAAGGTV